LTTAAQTTDFRRRATCTGLDKFRPWWAETQWPNG